MLLVGLLILQLFLLYQLLALNDRERFATTWKLMDGGIHVDARTEESDVPQREIEMSIY